MRAAAVCCHPPPHPERLTGGKTRRSSTYPRELVTRIVEGFIAIPRSNPEQRFDDPAAKHSINDHYLLKTAGNQAKKKEILKNYLLALDVGRMRLGMLGHGAATTEWEGPFPGTFGRDDDAECQFEWHGEAVTDYIPGGSTPSSMPYPHYDHNDTRPSALAKEMGDDHPPAGFDDPARPAPLQRAGQIVAGPKEALD